MVSIHAVAKTPVSQLKNGILFAICNLQIRGSLPMRARIETGQSTSCGQALPQPLSLRGRGSVVAFTFNRATVASHYETILDSHRRRWCWSRQRVMCFHLGCGEPHPARRNGTTLPPTCGSFSNRSMCCPHSCKAAPTSSAKLNGDTPLLRLLETR
jgi:hypothetical protein